MKYINWGLNQPPILSRVESLGYKIFTQKEYDLNIIGIRSQDRRPGLFDDEIRVCYKEGFDWIEERYKATTDPSMEQHRDPDNPKGVAILKPGQYRGVYKIDKHGGKYCAMPKRSRSHSLQRQQQRRAHRLYQRGERILRDQSAQSALTQDCTVDKSIQSWVPSDTESG